MEIKKDLLDYYAKIHNSVLEKCGDAQASRAVAIQACYDLGYKHGKSGFVMGGKILGASPNKQQGNNDNVS